MLKPKRDFWYALIILLLIALCGQFYYSYKYKPAHEIEVFYNHDVELNKKIVDVIRNAHKFVYFAIYTFTRNDIRDALLAAKRDGLEVRGITDRDQEAKIDAQGGIIKELRDAGIPVETQDHAGIMHAKAVVTDTAYASGSYNWTAAATNLNDEILEVGHDEKVRAQYERDIREILDKYKSTDH